MRAPSFWYKPRGLKGAALLPLALIYRAASLYRRASTSPISVSVPLICVGNIVTGGAGKTPVALAIAEILEAAGKKPVFVTRGYGGQEKGPLEVDLNRHTSKDVGDEALLLARVAPVWVGHDRAATVKAASAFASHIILDDGMQNPHLKPDQKFLVIDGEQGVGNGWLLPAGPLRETLADVKERITAIILIGKSDQQKISSQVSCPFIRARWQDKLPPTFNRLEKYFAFAGIGRPEKFFETCRDAGLKILGTKNFPDHHPYTSGELVDLEKTAISLNAKLLTTEKDWVRLDDHFRSKITPLPAQLIFDNAEDLIKLIHHY